jgi:hypothetical protein
MIIPFQLDLPKDTDPSFNQISRKGMNLNFEDIYQR